MTTWWADYDIKGNFWKVIKAELIFLLKKKNEKKMERVDRKNILLIIWFLINSKLHNIKSYKQLLS